MVWQNIKGLELDKKIGELERQQLKLNHSYHKRLIEYEKLRSSESIIQTAKEKFGMIPTSKKDFIQLGIKDKQKLMEKFLNTKSWNE